MRSLRTVAFLATLSSLPLTLSAQQRTNADSGHTQVAGGEVISPKKSVRIAFVYDADTQEPIVDAQVTDFLTRNSVKTSVTGNFGLYVPTFVKASGALITVKKVGYRQAGPIPVDPESDSLLMVPMQKVPQELPAVLTTASYRIDRDLGQREGFAARCSVLHTTCLHEDWISGRPAYKLSDFLVNVKAEGIKPVCGSQTRGVSSIIKVRDPSKSKEPRVSSQCLAKMQSTGPGLCTPTYFVDGQVWSPIRGAEAQDELDQIFGSLDLKGIEIYRAETARPMRFQGDPRCGVIVIWTQQ